MIPADSSYGAVSKMVTRMVRHYDQDVQQSNAALHWDTIRPVLLKAFAKHGARDFSEKHWLQLIHEGSSNTRFEYCEDSNNSLAYFVEEFFSARVPSSSAEVRGLVFHDIKEVEGVRQQEQQEDKRDEKEGDEVNGEVEEVPHRAHAP